MSEYLLGASYYPEWWDESEWAEDFSKMAALGLNCVRMGEFAWNMYEPQDGKFNFEPMKKAVTLAGEYGISVIMCTPTAICPSWLYEKHPGVKGGNANGAYSFTGRKGNCLSDEVFVKYALRICEKQSQALADCKNIIAWQLDNEPGHPPVCFDENCEKKFRSWLREKYGSIENLNKRYFNAFWSNEYTDFEEIRFPVNSAEGGFSPSMRLDYRLFFSDNFNSFLQKQSVIVRKNCPSTHIYTNWSSLNWPVDCKKGSEYLDFCSWDNYVSVPVGDNYKVQLRSVMEHDICRGFSADKKSFLIAEQCCAPQALAKAESVAMQTWLDVAQGAFGTVFFECRAPLGGEEQAYPSLLEADGSYNRCEGVIRELCARTEKLYPLIKGAATVSQAAGIYSYINCWSTISWKINGVYDETFFTAYGALKNQLKADTDVITPDDDYSSYKIILAPNLMILTENEKSRLEKFVEDGGVLIADTKLHTRTDTNLVRRLPSPGLFEGKVGVKAVAQTSSYDAVKTKTADEKIGVKFADGSECEIEGGIYKLETDENSEVIAVYTFGELKNTPAVIMKKIGKGRVFIFGTDSENTRFYEKIIEQANKFAAIAPLAEASEGIILSSRIKDGKRYIFAVNANTSPSEICFNKEVKDAFTGEALSGKTTVDGLDTLVAVCGC